MGISNIDPNFTDQVVINIDKPLATFQGNRVKQTDMIKEIRNQLKNCQFLITCDLAVHFTFFVDERIRYETHLSPDVDNVIKRALDAICGPQGILINDTQVQFVTSKWIDDEVTSTDSMIVIEPDEISFIEKKNISFVKFHKNLCIPFSIKAMNSEEKAFVREFLEKLSSTRSKLEKCNAEYRTIRNIMPTQRVFNSSKLSGFDVIDVCDLV